MTTTPNVQELDIVLNVKVKTDALDQDEVIRIFRDAIHHETERAHLRCDEFLKECQRFEEEYHFSSNEFLERFESGELGDDADFFTWYAFKHGFDVWERRYQILLGSTIQESSPESPQLAHPNSI